MGGTSRAAMLSGTARTAFVSAAGKEEAARRKQPAATTSEARDFAFISISEVDIPGEKVTLRQGDDVMFSFYNCNRCPSYCCSYTRIPVESSDVRRLARPFGPTPEAAARKLSKKGDEAGEVILRH